MDSRRLVVWISTGILGFQGATLAFDLLNCTALSWLVLRVNGLPRLERQQKQQPSAAERGLVMDPDAKPKILAGLALGSSVPGNGREEL